MRLAVAPENLARGVDHDGAVVADAGGFGLEDGGDDVDAVLARLGPHGGDGDAVCALRLVDMAIVAVLEDIGVVEELRHDHEIGQLGRNRPVDIGRGTGHVLRVVGRAVHLDQAEFHRPLLRAIPPPRRGPA